MIRSMARKIVRKSKRSLRSLLTSSGFIRKLASDGKKLRTEGLEVQQALLEQMKRQRESHPFDESRETIFMIITCGQAVRTFLLSDVLKLLKERYNVVIISQYGSLTHFVESHLDNTTHVLPWIKNRTFVVEKMCNFYHMMRSPSKTHKSILENLKRNQKQERDDNTAVKVDKNYKLYRFVKALSYFISYEAMQNMHHQFVRRYLPREMIEELFGAYQPTRVLSTAANHSSAWPLTAYGKKMGCETIANIISWDNISTKGMIDTSCGSYTLWSEEMSRDMDLYFPKVKCTKKVVGSPQFDVYFDESMMKSREDFLEPLNLDPKKPYVLYTTNTPVAMPDEHIIVLRFWERFKKTPWGEKASLLVRLHPKDTIERYTEVDKMDDVAVTLAGHPKWIGADAWVPERDDMVRLANTMRHAAVSINVASTMSLESFCLDLPTVNVAYKSGEMDWNTVLWSFDMYHTSVHYKAVVENDAVSVAKSHEALVEATIDALENPEKRKPAMSKVLSMKAHQSRGGAGKLFVDAIAARG